MDWSKAAISALIEAYSEEPALVDTGDSLYHNKHARKEKLNQVAKRVAVVLPGVSGDDCKGKFNSLRSHYGAEMKKIKCSEKSGCSSEAVYKPAVWWFKSMDFIKDHINPRKSRSNVELRPFQSQSLSCEGTQSSLELFESQEVISLVSAGSPVPAEIVGAELLKEPAPMNVSPEPLLNDEAESPQTGPYSKRQKRKRTEEDLFNSAIHVLSSINSKVMTPAAASQPPPPTQVTFGQYIDTLLCKMDGHPRIQSKVKWGMLEVYKEGEEEMFIVDVENQ